MTKKRKILYLARVFVYLSFLFFGLSGLTQASSLNINIQGSQVYIHAKQVPLIRVLQAISDRAGIFLDVGDPLRDPITLDAEGIDVEECIKRLLSNHNYSLIFKKTIDDDFVLTGIRVLGKSSKTRIETPIQNGEVRHPVVISRSDTELTETPGGPVKKYEKDWFTQAFEDSESVAKKITTETKIEEPYSGSIRLKEISAGSVFSEIGLIEGDVINDINGKRVKTKIEFINILQKASEERTVIRIERINENGNMDPIYMELH